MKYPTLLERFLTYVKVNTRSDENSTTTPSTQSQVDFATNVLIPEMKRVGLQNVYYLPNGFAIGTLPANDPSLTRKIGFISHMDTADFNAEGVNPQVIENYDGGPVGIETIAAAVSEERDTIEDVYEPYLMQLGFLGRTPRGRVATKLAYDHLGISQTGK